MQRGDKDARATLERNGFTFFDHWVWIFRQKIRLGGGVAMLTPSEKPVFPDNNLHVEES